MAPENHLYNYHPLDKLLTEYLGPAIISDHLDDLLYILMLQAVSDELPPSWHQVELYNTTRHLRNIFRNLQPLNSES